MQNYVLCKAYFYMAVSKIAAGIRRDGRAATDLQTLNGGLPTEAMVAHVLVAKYAWHLPLYRQAGRQTEAPHQNYAVSGGRCS